MADTRQVNVAEIEQLIYLTNDNVSLLNPLTPTARKRQTIIAGYV